MVPVFISYHGSDISLATELRKSLKRLSSDFDVFLDKYSIRPSQDYEQAIANEIARSEWFLIICTGFPHRDADMLWSFFEAGQFRATLPANLAATGSRRIVCLFDMEPPTVLSRFHGVKIEPCQLSGAKIDMTMEPASENDQFDSTAISHLLEDMLANEPLAPLRELRDEITRGMLREESSKIIRLFEKTDPGKRIDEKTLQPRISFELMPGQRLVDTTSIKGYEESLRTLFGIETDEATWAHIVDNCSNNGIKPIWICDVESAAAAIMKNETPNQNGNKCVLRNEIYRVFTARYEIYKDMKRVVYVAFLPATTKRFDMTRRSSMMLSSLILSTRFREQLIPQVKAFETAADTFSALMAFYRNLVAIEIEAKQFGLNVETGVEDEPPLLAVLTKEENKKEIRAGTTAWRSDRAAIESMFSDIGKLEEKGAEYAAELTQMMTRVRPVNKRFIEILNEEMLLQSQRES